MILRILNLHVNGPTSVAVTFNDGTQGSVDLSPLLDGPMLTPLREPECFAQAILDATCGTIVWPGGADLAPEAIRDLIVHPALT